MANVPDKHADKNGPAALEDEFMLHDPVEPVDGALPQRQSHQDEIHHEDQESVCAVLDRIAKPVLALVFDIDQLGSVIQTLQTAVSRFPHRIGRPRDAHRRRKDRIFRQPA